MPCAQHPAGDPTHLPISAGAVHIKKDSIVVMDLQTTTLLSLPIRDYPPTGQVETHFTSKGGSVNDWVLMQVLQPLVFGSR